MKHALRRTPELLSLARHYVERPAVFARHALHWLRSGAPGAFPTDVSGFAQSSAEVIVVGGGAGRPVGGGAVARCGGKRDIGGKEQFLWRKLGEGFLWDQWY